MRNPDRIDELLITIARIWKEHPDLRLCQLIGNCFMPILGEDLYYVEDDLLAERLKIHYKGLLNGGKK